MDKNNNFLTITEQIKHLEDEGIIIKNKQKVNEILSKNSYYNIINGCNEPFLFRKKPKKYIKNVDFMEIYALYFFDNRLRNILFSSILEIENNIKSEIVYSFLNSRDKNNILIHINDDYLKIDNYDNAKGMNNSMGVIAEFQKIIAKYLDTSDALKHYLTIYSFVPLWVLSVYMTFGNISKFYSVMKINDRQTVSKKYNLPENDFRIILRVLTLVRNSCAHRNRLYCLTHKYTLPKFDSTLHPNQFHFTSLGIGNKNLFSAIICISLLLSKKQMKALINAIDNELKILSNKLKVISIMDIMKYLGFPADWKNLV